MHSLDDLLTAAGHVDDIGPRQQERAFVAVSAALRSLPAASVPGRSRWRRWIGAHGRLVLTGAAVTAAAGLLAIPVLSIGNRQLTAEASAATLLRAAGRAAGAQQGGWRHAAYWHVASVTADGNQRSHRDIWVSHYGLSVLRDDALWGPKVIVSLGKNVFDGLTWDQLYALPTDPGKLRSILTTKNAGHGPSPAAELFAVVGDLLRESPAPPALRKALYEVAAGIPGVRVVGHMTDAIGRTGTGFELKRNGETLIVDPKTGALLGEGPIAYVSQGPASTAPPATARIGSDRGRGR